MMWEPISSFLLQLNSTYRIPLSCDPPRLNTDIGAQLYQFHHTLRTRKHPVGRNANHMSLWYSPELGTLAIQLLWCKAV